MHHGLLLLLFLVAWLGSLRVSARHELWAGAVAWGRRRRDGSGWWAAYLCAFAASWLLLRDWRVLFAVDAVVHADASAHAGIMQALGSRGAPHGWIDAYDGGFPLGVNYPPLGWVLGAALVRAHFSAAQAVQLLGLVPYILAPPLVVMVARAAGARPLAALAGALVVAWISPYNAWLGTYENYLALGVVSQAIAVPLFLLTARAVVGDVGRWQAPLLAALLASAHPQITVAAALLSLPLLLFGAPSPRRRLVGAYLGAGLAGVAIYGPGLLALRIPFGWIPTSTITWIAGYRVDRLYYWVVDGTLFDSNRAPIITTLWILATLTLLALARHRVPRLVLLTSIWSLLLCTLGRALPLLGPLGEKVLSFAQPQRAFALVPFALAAVIVVASHELLERGARLRFVPALRGLGQHLVPSLIGAALIVVSWVGIGTQSERLGAAIASEREWMRGEGECGPTVEARDWVKSLDRGRLSLVEEKPYDECPSWMGVELASPVPNGLSFGAGAHVGVLTQAFARIRPTRDGSAARAEAMGVRYLMHRPEQRPGADGGWRIRDANAHFEISERLSGTDLIGVGCIERAWSGSYEALRLALVSDVDADAITVSDPHVLTQLEHTEGPLVRVDVQRGACDWRSAVVTERPREPGAYEATIHTLTEVDVVIRATAFPTWVVRVDGEPRPVRVVAPGFFSVRVAPGQHEVVAVFAPPRFYVAGLGLAGVLIALVSAMARRRAPSV